MVRRLFVWGVRGYFFWSKESFGVLLRHLFFTKESHENPFMLLIYKEYTVILGLTQNPESTTSWILNQVQDDKSLGLG